MTWQGSQVQSLSRPPSPDHNPLSEFFSLYSHDFVRVACCVPRTRVADTAYNLAETLRLAAEGDKADVGALKGWRRELFGDTALKLINGEVALRFVDRKIEAVEL